MKSTFRIKIFLSIYFLSLTGAQAQCELISDSWANAGRWFKKDTYQQEDAWYWLAGGATISLAFYYDLPLQQGLRITSSDLQSSLSSGFEPMGNPIYMGSAGLAAYLGGCISGNEELKGVSSAALQSMLTSGLVVLSLKMAFHRVRPEEQELADPYRFYGPSLQRDRLSFPSGHSAIAFSAAASISEYYGNPWYVAVPLYSLAGLTAWQRVFDQKHWPSDVITGAVIGVFIGRKIATWQREQNPSVSLNLALLPGGALGLGARIPIN